MATTTLWRPVGPEELKLIEESGWRAYPPRLPEQPIFYPVTNRAYAQQIARDWNVPASGAGFVTRFEIDSEHLSKYPEHVVGASQHSEHWIPAEELDAFNQKIVGQIAVTDRYGAGDDADQDALLFVNAYDGSQEPAIAFAWNGQHADNFVDTNLEFRQKVMALVLARVDTVGLELIRDLLTAETQCAKEAWGVHIGVSKLAQALLSRGGTRYLDVYVDALGRGMDAYCACRNIQLTESTTRTLIEACRSRMESGETKYEFLLEALVASLETMTNPAKEAGGEGAR